jgi:peptide/nickel transport system permease protein
MSRRRPGVIATTSGLIGTVVFVVLVLVAVFGPFFAPHSIATAIGFPGASPGHGELLGADSLGRDVLSRLLSGGRTALGLGALATAISYVLGLSVGLVAGYNRSWLDGVLMRSVDVLLAFPALVILLLLVSGLGSGISVLLLGVALVQLPGISRVVRTATLEVSGRAYVEAAVARGERVSSILIREVLRNIRPVILADFGIRFGYSIILIASMNYLNLGLKPPTADWGVMISENREIISLNPWAVLAPALLLALLTVSVNLMADSYSKSVGRSTVVSRRSRRASAALSLAGKER